MNVLDGYDSDEEFSFNPTSEDWIPEDPLLLNTKPLRDDYRLLNCVGHGSYSAVYKVENCKTGEILCAKNVRYTICLICSSIQKLLIGTDFLMSTMKLVIMERSKFRI